MSQALQLTAARFILVATSPRLTTAPHTVSTIAVLHASCSAILTQTPAKFLSIYQRELVQLQKQPLNL
jgi:hypothetical protein